MAFFAHAELHHDVKEFTGTVTPMMANSLLPGIRAHLLAPDGTSGPPVWIPAGTSRELFSSKSFSSDIVRLGFGQRVIPLTFFITLENFEVPRDEGTDTPSNYISSLRFDEPSTGRVVRDKAYMNSPAMFPGDFWRSLLGWNYKFSQANWKPAEFKRNHAPGVCTIPAGPLSGSGRSAFAAASPSCSTSCRSARRASGLAARKMKRYHDATDDKIFDPARDCSAGGHRYAACRSRSSRHQRVATLAVQDHGRKKPFTTFAHEMLLTLSGKDIFAAGKRRWKSREGR